jgi:hypothetical protein
MTKWLALAALLLASPAYAQAPCTVVADSFDALRVEVEKRTTSASDGDRICIGAGDYSSAGNDIVLPHRPGAAAFVTITTTGGCPETRASGSTAGLAVFKTSGSEVFITAPRANWWKFECVAFGTQGTSELFAVNVIGGLIEPDVSQRAYKIHFDRVTIQNQPVNALRQFIRVALVEDFSLTRSYCGDILIDGRDTQCVAMVNAYCKQCVFADNYLGASTEPIIAGGGDPAVPNLNPDGITIVGNTFFKDPATAARGTHKHHIEFKQGLNIRIAGNVFWNNWTGPGHGTAPSILLSPRNGGACPGCRVAFVTVENNRFYNVAQAFQVIGRDDFYSSLETDQIVFRNNLAEVTDNGFMVLYSPDGVTVSRNTFAVQAGRPIPNAWSKWGAPDVKLTDTLALHDNVAINGHYGINGLPYGMGTAALKAFVAAWASAGNVIAGLEDQGNMSAADYPPGQVFLTSEALQAEFVNFAGRDYCLRAGSPYAGKGADCALLPPVVPPTVPPVEPPPTSDPCVEQPLIVKVTAWPKGNGKKTSGTWNPNGAVLAVATFKYPPMRFEAVDDRGCTALIYKP